jgi:hypothetical protein
VELTDGALVTMLRISSQILPTEAIFELEGKLAGPWVQEREGCWRNAVQPDRPLKVLLCAVTFIDEKGTQLLAEMYRQGVELVAEGCMNKALVEQIVRGERR